MRGLARQAYRDEQRDIEQPIQQYNNTRNHRNRRDNQPEIKRQNPKRFSDKYRHKNYLSLINPSKSNQINDKLRQNYIEDPSKRANIISLNPDRKKKVAVYQTELRVVTLQQMDQQIQEYMKSGPGHHNQKKIQNQNKPKEKYQIILDNQDQDKTEEVVDLSYSDFEAKKKVQESKVNQQNLSFSVNEDDDWGQINRDKEETQVLQQIKREPQKKEKEKDEGSCASHQELNKGFIDKSNTSNDSSEWINQKQIINQQQEQEQDSSSSSNDESFVSSVHSNHHDPHHQNSYSHMDESSSLVDANKIEQTLKLIDQSSQFQQKDIMLNLQVQNTLSLTIKEIFLKKLHINLKLGTIIDGIIVKNCEIQIQKLVTYISFFQIDVRYPKIYHQNNIEDKSFKLCRIKVPPINKSENKNQSKFIKKPKKIMQSIQETLVSLLKISKVELKCMNCDKANQVAVIENTQGFNEAGLSCAGCAEKIFAKMRFSLEP